MTANLLPSLQARYVPTADLWPERPMPNVRTTNPNEAEREDLLLSKLGPRGWGRIHHFRHFYAQGWGERGHGRPLSPRSLEAFFRFLETMPIPQRTAPKVFLTDSGHLELCWQDEQGAAVQVEFTPSMTEFYIESSETEGTVPHAAITSLAAMLPRP